MILWRLRRLLARPPGFVARRLLLELRARWDDLVTHSIPLRRVLGDEPLEQAWERLLARAPDLPDAQAAGRPAFRMDWHRDPNNGYVWPRVHFRRIRFAGGDVRLPWELSRHQWLLGHEGRVARDVLRDWIRHNPYGIGVNWASPMEVALRAVAWVWLFRAHGRDPAWQDFRAEFLTALYGFGHFVDTHLELSYVNGNHYLANGLGLLAVGRCLGQEAWERTGMGILEEEILRQTTPDGVDFEGSIPYHMLVVELLELGARLGKPSPAYQERLQRMQLFARACRRPDGSVPLLGDNDDGRALRGWQGTPLGRSRGFPEGGYFVMANGRDHVAIDCAPVGFAGTGGHGHNDCLAFEAMLDGVLLVRDAGCFHYTLDPEQRNLFRSTAYHNTPQVEGEELNRFVRPELLWVLRNDAVPRLERWEAGPERDLFEGSHSGYERLGVRPFRRIELRHADHALQVEDRWEGAERSVLVPLLLAPEAEVHENEVQLGGRRFTLTWEGPFQLSVERGRVAPHYGVALEAPRLVWRGRSPSRLRWALQPA